MAKLEQIEKFVSELDPPDLEAFSAWFEAFQVEKWDRHIENDAAAKLYGLADKALSDFRAGKTRRL